MSKQTKYFDISLRTEYINNEQLPKFNRGFNIVFKNISIRISNNSLNDVLNAISTALSTNKSIAIEGLSIKHLSTKDITKIKKRNLYVGGCQICDISSPIFELSGINDYIKLYLCKRHLRKLYDYLNSINDACYITIRPFEDFEIKVKN